MSRCMTVDPRSLIQDNEPEKGETGSSDELRDLERERAATRRQLLEKEREKLEDGETPRPDLRG